MVRDYTYGIGDVAPRIEISSHPDDPDVYISVVVPNEKANGPDYGDPGVRPEGVVMAGGTFSRGAINRLIRDLRRARDRAFGEDE